MKEKRNEKKQSNNETPYPLSGQHSPTRAKKDGNHDAKGSANNKKMTTNNKNTHEKPSESIEKSPEQMKLDSPEQVKEEPLPAVYSSSINKIKYSTQTDLIPSTTCRSTNNWKYSDHDESGPNQPFQHEDIIGKDGKAYLFAKSIQLIDQGEAPLHTCHSLKYWLEVTKAAFNPEHMDYNENTSHDVRYLQLRMAVSDPSVIFTYEWKGDALQSTRLTCAWGAATAFFGSHFLPSSSYSENDTVPPNQHATDALAKPLSPGQNTTPLTPKKTHRQKFIKQDS
jgi:hypothetical protein